MPRYVGPRSMRPRTANFQGASLVYNQLASSRSEPPRPLAQPHQRCLATLLQQRHKYGGAAAALHSRSRPQKQHAHFGRRWPGSDADSDACPGRAQRERGSRRRALPPPARRLRRIGILPGDPANSYLHTGGRGPVSLDTINSSGGLRHMPTDPSRARLISQRGPRRGPRRDPSQRDAHHKVSRIASTLPSKRCEPPC